MYRIIPLKVSITVLVVLGAALLALTMNLWEWRTGEPIEWWVVPRFVNMVAVLVVSVLAVGIQFLWRPVWRLAPVLNRWVFPDLHGTWRGELLSTWVDPETGEGPGPVAATLTVALGWFDVSVRMETDKMRSFSNRVFLEREKGTNVFRVWYGYRHDPTPASRPGNPPHDGMAYLEHDADNPDRLRGRYYTNRETTGEFTLVRE